MYPTKLGSKPQFHSLRPLRDENADAKVCLKVQVVEERPRKPCVRATADFPNRETAMTCVLSVIWPDNRPEI